MKRLAPLMLLMVFLYNAGGYFILFNYLQHNIRHEAEQKIKKGLHDDQLTLLVISSLTSSKTSNPDVKWIRSGKEYMLNGELFDVVKAVKKDGKTFYYSITDKKEKELLAKLLKIKSRRFDKRIRPPMNLYYVTDYNQQFIAAGLLYRYYSKTENYKTIDCFLNSPPPEFA